MKYVYLLYEDDGCSYNVIGVFTDKEKADKKQEELDDKSFQHRYVDEIEVNTVFCI
jgi:hypothetical protein